MDLIHVTIAVKDMEESLRFYNEILGLPIVRRFASPASEIVFLNAGGTDIELIARAGQADVTIGQDISLGFTVDSLDASRAALNEKGITTTDTIQPNPAVKFFFFNDPNGVRIQYVQRLQH